MYADTAIGPSFSPNRRKIKKEDYISEMKMSNYDFFFILFNNILCEEEIWMVGELRKLGKPFFLVRSKIDIYI
jgi:hypothetical protein